MKYLICIFFVLACTLDSLAIIRTVSNNPGYPAQYATIPAAISAASPGDTIYIYPSLIAYNENIVTSKQLVLIGPGINPLRPNHLSAAIGGSIIITTASANGFILMGLQLNVVAIGSSSVSVNNVVVSECKFISASPQFYCNNILFENNWIAANVYAQFFGVSQVIIQNNIFESGVILGDGDAIVRNNIFAGNDANRRAIAPYYGDLAGSPSVKIHNNVFFKNNPLGPPRTINSGNYCQPCEYKNNIYHLTNNPPPSNVNSSGNLNADPLFVNYPIAGAPFSFDYNYHLQSSSPGINYGLDGKDVGMWGGFSPINAGFEPPIPRIYELNVSNSNVPAGGTIQLTIKATRAQ